MIELFNWIESLGFSVWVRESVSLWAYPGMLSFHTIGLGFVVGISAAFDLRILGVASGLPLPPMRKLFPVMWAGFWLNALSGLALLMAYATKMLTNPIFVIKLVLIALAVANVLMLNKRVFADAARAEEAAASKNVKILAATSLALWGLVILAGRFVAYIDIVTAFFGGGEGG